MQIEMKILLAATLLGLIHLFAAAAAGTLQRGIRWNLSSRDVTPQPLTGKPARLARAFENFKETFPFFAASIFILNFSQKSGSLGEAGAYAYIIGRAIYIPCYVWNLIGLRTLIWVGATGGILAVLLQTVSNFKS